MSDYNNTNIEKVREDLKKLDEGKFEDRANRLKDLRENTLTIFGDFPNNASSYLDEASNCYINGYFRSCIFACSVSADQILRHELIKLSKNKFKTLNNLKGKTLGKCIKYFFDTIKKDSFNCQLNYTIKKFQIINEIRNILSVHPAYIDFNGEDLENTELKDRLISEDVYRVYELLYRLLYPEHLAGEKMKSFLKNYVVSYTKLGKNGGEEENMKASMYDLLKNNFRVGKNHFASDFFGSDEIKYNLLKPLAFETYKILGQIIHELYGEANEK